MKVGDKVLAYGRDIAPDAKVFPAGILIVMKSEDVKAKQARDVAVWSTRGTGGIVTAADSAAGTITISTRTATGTKPVIITTTKSTVLRRYAPDSTKFDDAKVAPFSAIVVGDQVRAKGTKNDDGTQFAADEVVSGHFRNLAGLIVSVDASAKIVTLTDLVAKKIVTVKVTDQTNLRKLNPQMAQMIAARFKGAGAGAGAKAAERLGGEGANGTNGGAGGAQANAGAGGTAGDAGAGGRGPRSRRCRTRRTRRRFSVDARAFAGPRARRFCERRCGDDRRNVRYGRFNGDRDHDAWRRGSSAFRSGGRIGGKPGAAFAMEPRRGRRRSGRRRRTAVSRILK